MDVDLDALPPGRWLRARSRFPNPLTPLFMDYRMQDILVQAFRRAFDSASIPMPAPANLPIHGYWYGGPNGPADTSPERIGAFEARVRDERGTEAAESWAEIKPRSAAQLRSLQRVQPGSLDLGELDAHIQSVIEAGRETMAVHHINQVGYMVAVGKLGLFAQQHLGLSEGDVIQLLSGASPASSEPGRALEELARTIATDPELRVALETSTDILPPAIAALAADWLDEYGHHCPAFEFDQPLVVERPALFIKLLRDAMSRSGTATPPGQSETELSLLESRLAPELRAEFRGLLSVARLNYAVRDDDVSHVFWSQGLLRLAFLEAGRRLVAAGALVDAEDVWYLQRPEMERFLDSGLSDPLQAVVSERKLLRANQIASPPPLALGTPVPFVPPPLSQAAQDWLQARQWAFAAMDAPPPGGEGPAGTVQGVGASPGDYTGTARVVADESEFDRIEPGDVLVCKVTSPSWNVVCAQVGAIVTDFGGQLSHPAIIAREFGIPAVVGTVGGTARIPDGATVRVDGDGGTVSWT